MHWTWNRGKATKRSESAALSLADLAWLRSLIASLGSWDNTASRASLERGAPLATTDLGGERKELFHIKRN